MESKVQKTTIFHVARHIVEAMDETLTPLKLQKLAYYSQAWCLAWTEVPMFEEDFQAWANGPVNPELYEKHKGMYSLPSDFLSDYSDFELSSGDTKTIQSIISFYGDKEPFFLSELTHRERPWREARGNTPLGAISTAVITKESMQDYYAGLVTAS
jgi:uncharacterized phage-associated protein